MSGVAAALWIAGLLYAAPLLRTEAAYGLASRVRDALILGVAIACTLAALHLLYPAALWMVLAAAVFGAYRRGGTHAWEPVPYFTLTALALVAWPPLVQPPLDGDTLAYHLPNAAAWANAHSLYANLTRYWWYPPASELFASALYSVAGPFATCWSGTLGLALLSLRVRDRYRAAAPSHPLFGDLAGAATATMLPLAWQAGTLQNDVWLAAFLLETVTALETGRAAAMRSACISFFVKPYGWLMTTAVGLPRPVVLVPPLALAIFWIARDALLARSAPTPVLGTVAGSVWSTTIGANAPESLRVLLTAFLFGAPLAAAAFAAAVAAPLYVRGSRALAIAAPACALIFFVLPYAYDNGTAQLAAGASLRYAAPAVALGFVAFAPVSVRLRLACQVAFSISALWGAGVVVSTFANDAPALSAFAVAALAGAICAACARSRSWLPAGAFAAVAAGASTILAARNTADFVTNASAYGLEHSGVFEYAARARPPRFVSVGLRSGALLDVDPAAEAIDGDDADGCALGKHYGAAVVTVAENSRTPAYNAERLRAAHRCGRVVYEDLMTVVTEPR